MNSCNRFVIPDKYFYDFPVLNFVGIFSTPFRFATPRYTPLNILYTPPRKLKMQPMKFRQDVARTLDENIQENSIFFRHFSEKLWSEKIKICRNKMTHFAGESWNGNHLPTSAAVYNSSEVPFPQIWNQEGAAAYNEIIGFQDLGEKLLRFA